MRRFTRTPKGTFSLDLHVLSALLAFILSRDHTLSVDYFLAAFRYTIHFSKIDLWNLKQDKYNRTSSSCQDIDPRLTNCPKPKPGLNFILYRAKRQIKMQLTFCRPIGPLLAQLRKILETGRLKLGREAWKLYWPYLKRIPSEGNDWHLIKYLNHLIKSKL